MHARIIMAALVSAGLALPAVAQESKNIAYVIVDKAALASHKLLKHRIAVAVEEVCRSYAVVEPYQWPEIDACRKSAWASADRQLARLSPKTQGRIALAVR